MIATTIETPAGETLRRAEILCRRRDLRFTALRRRVLRIVCRSHRPPTAYDILRKLGAAARPPTAYRTLDFLEMHGFLHKIKSRGVYAVCGHPQSAHACYFLVCAVCGRCDECCGRRLDNAVNAAAEAGGFTPRAVTLEIEGVCAACRE
ncbi:MAG: Fur family transcriptional regulator [Gammaproteobacteria bacterium]